MAMSLTTPRSALRTINDDQSSIRAMKSTQARKPGTATPKNNLFKKPGIPLQTLSTKNQLHIHTDPEPKQKTRTKEKVITKAPEPLPEKEYLKIFDPAEDLKPKTDKALIGVVERIRNWRPPCLFGVGRPDSDIDDSDDEDRDSKPGMDNIADLLPPPEDPFGDDELANLSEVHIPTIDIEDLPIPYLDDSIDIEPNMGTLEIWETSTPASLSPRSVKDVSSPEEHSHINDNSVL
ncbi:uncharacterized protein LOC123546366 [Mercenaria mercenaria]|uniref:uncharacterized protein LOC123546366 n=1 Tax=Mercenaria mercenaria TaxID=6596 RepID=UPI00234EB542|nr:uncharacterized protein LOC123546366 [Mercenaria mercenaria]